MLRTSTLLVPALAASVLVPVSASGAIVSAVGLGSSAETEAFRSTDVAKSFSVTGVDAYGVDGYQLFSVAAPNNGSSDFIRSGSVLHDASMALEPMCQPRAPNAG